MHNLLIDIDTCNIWMLPEEGAITSLCSERFLEQPHPLLSEVFHAFSCGKTQRFTSETSVMKFVWRSETRLFLGGGRSGELKKEKNIKASESSPVPIQTATHISSLTSATRRAGVYMPQVSSLAMLLCVKGERACLMNSTGIQIYDKGCGNKITHLLQI